MLSCKELAQRHASDHIDDQLSGSLRWNVRLHLMMCGHCRRFIKQLKLVKKTLLTRPEPAIDEKQVQSLAHELLAVHRQQKKSSPPL